MRHFLIEGVDVAKFTLDICFKPAGTFMQISNDAEGFKQWLSKLQELAGQEAVLVIMEHTGLYSNRFERFLQSHSIAYCKIAALQIKRSLGVTRGKNDKIDARRIAEYGWLRKEILKPDDPLQQKIQTLRSLLSLRSKLVGDRSAYITRLKEAAHCGVYTAASFEGKLQEKMIKELTTAIRKADDQIKLFIKSDESLSQTSVLLQSIKGVGWVIATYMICSTENFKKFPNARKFNCYAGIAPFKYESGTSIKGRSRVSHLANKEIKTLLNLAAFTALRFDEEMKNYYKRRVSEGKRKMSCVNIIRAKIVARMFAVIKRQTPYQPLLTAA